jgi:hypothetical protein
VENSLINCEVQSDNNSFSTVQQALLLPVVFWKSYYNQPDYHSHPLITLFFCVLEEHPRLRDVPASAGGQMLINFAL